MHRDKAHNKRPQLSPINVFTNPVATPHPVVTPIDIACALLATCVFLMKSPRGREEEEIEDKLGYHESKQGMRKLVQCGPHLRYNVLSI